MISQDAAKLAALQQAAKVGMAGIEAGEAKSFADAAALQRHLKDLAAKARLLRDSTGLPRHLPPE